MQNPPSSASTIPLGSGTAGVEPVGEIAPIVSESATMLAAVSSVSSPVTIISGERVKAPATVIVPSVTKVDPV